MNNKIQKVLIVNRGEIVWRIHKTLKNMSIKSVSIYSDVDINALHRKVTDESIYIGGLSSESSYLNFEKILEAIKKSGADAVHPGFGFVSENPKFVEFMNQNNIRFIGPSAESMLALGDKINSKILAKKAGVNIVPGLIEPVDNLEIALKTANEIGYPVMIKASAGGGGKGMRILWSDSELNSFFNIVVSEAINNFNDGRVFIEKYIENPRHIEIQILGDKHGNVVHLGERECTIQRRNQKIIEEAPSPFFENKGQIGKKIRDEMGKQAVQLAKSIGYYSAGTVEFVVDQTGNFYFLEVNTRIQVEHPVTEEAIAIKNSKDSKLDLIQLMILIEEGVALPFTQNDVYFARNAIETRIYAENPESKFMPSSGKIEKYNEPTGQNLRVETGVMKGSEISIYYDPMIAKICTSGNSRNEAIKNMENALGQLIVSGKSLKTNINFLEQIIRLPEFIAGEFSTNFLEQKYKGNFSTIVSPKNTKLINQFLISYLILALNDVQFLSANGLIFATNINAKYYFELSFQKEVYGYLMEISKNGNDYQIISINDKKIGKKYQFISNVNGLLNIQEDVKNKVDSYFKYQKHDANHYEIEHNGFNFKAKIYPEIYKKYLHIVKNNNKGTLSNELILKAPLPGVIISVNISEGEIIDKDSNVLVIESMKMQNMICSPNKLKVKKIHLQAKDIVSVDQILIEFEEVNGGILE